MIHAQNYKKLSKSVKVTAKILAVLFFQTQCILIHLVTYLHHYMFDITVM